MFSTIIEDRPGYRIRQVVGQSHQTAWVRTVAFETS
jgi:hypothetical protein